jgi:cytochrome oxidase assembly protein ShyY1
MSAAKSDIKRWFGWLALVVVFSIACVYLSNWQFNRREEALVAMQQLAQNYDSPAVPIQQLATLDAFAKANEWRKVELVGKYLVDKSVLVRNRPLNGQPGFLQVVPFELSDGTVIAVERGWVPAGDQYQAPQRVPLPAEASQTVIGRTRASEPTLNRTAPPGQLATINIAALVSATQIEQKIYNKLYVRMASESLARESLSAESLAGVDAPKKLDKPQLGEGNHLSYALQWILFALMSAAALFWGIKKEREAQSGKKRVSKRKLLGQVDAETEDQFLDKQL